MRKIPHVSQDVVGRSPLSLRDLGQIAPYRPACCPSEPRTISSKFVVAIGQDESNFVLNHAAYGRGHVAKGADGDFMAICSPARLGKVIRYGRPL